MPEQKRKKSIQVDIDGKTNAVLAAQVEPLPDRTMNVRLSEDYEKVLMLVRSDDRLKELRAKHPYFVTQMC